MDVAAATVAAAEMTPVRASGGHYGDDPSAALSRTRCIACSASWRCWGRCSAAIFSASSSAASAKAVEPTASSM